LKLEVTRFSLWQVTKVIDLAKTKTNLEILNKIKQIQNQVKNFPVHTTNLKLMWKRVLQEQNYHYFPDHGLVSPKSMFKFKLCATCWLQQQYQIFFYLFILRNNKVHKLSKKDLTELKPRKKALEAPA
jgi:hypothetical protein